MQELFVAAVYVFYLFLGFMAPFVAGLGYIWVDIFTPQNVAPHVLGDFPVALVLGLACFAGYTLFDRRERPHIGLPLLLILAFAGWMSLTQLWAVAPDAAEKWTWAFKVMIFAAFTPFLFRSRVQIEAALLTIIFALSSTVLAVAAKTLVTGGGYGAREALVGANSGLAEGSTLSMVAVAILPLVTFVSRYSLILAAPRRLVSVACRGFSACCVVTAVGLFTRTGLVALGVYVVLAWWQSRHKIVIGAAVAAGILVLLPLMGTVWEDRMSTIENPESDPSAAGRLAVWQWTLSYVAEHPLGGGFNVYEFDKVELPSTTGVPRTVTGVAFHSIYFEILGEMGIVGLAVWASLIAAFFIGLVRLRRQARQYEEGEWLVGLTTALASSVTIYLVGGAFIGVGFQPTLYYLIGIAIAAQEYWRRSGKATGVTLRGRRPRGLPSAGATPEAA